MSEFETLIENSVQEAAGTMGQLFTYQSQSVRGVFNELQMSISGMTYGDEEEATAEIVFAVADLASAPQKGDTLTRTGDSVAFKVITFDSVPGSYKLNVKRVGKA